MSNRTIGENVAEACLNETRRLIINKLAQTFGETEFECVEARKLLDSKNSTVAVVLLLCTTKFPILHYRKYKVRGKMGKVYFFTKDSLEKIKSFNEFISNKVDI